MSTWNPWGLNGRVQSTATANYIGWVPAKRERDESPRVMLAVVSPRRRHLVGVTLDRVRLEDHIKACQHALEDLKAPPPRPWCGEAWK